VRKLPTLQPEICPDSTRRKLTMGFTTPTFPEVEPASFLREPLMQRSDDVVLTARSAALSGFFLDREQTQRSLVELGDGRHLSPACRAVMVSDGTLTRLLSALYMEDIVTECEVNDEARPGFEACRWLQIDDVACQRRVVSLVGGMSGRTYVRAHSYLFAPRLPDSYLIELSRPGASIGAQLLSSRIYHRRELIWIRPGTGDCMFSRLFRILVQDRPAILIQEDVLHTGEL
jgi:chorismate-pyruvate lyase